MEDMDLRRRMRQLSMFSVYDKLVEDAKIFKIYCEDRMTLAQALDSLKNIWKFHLSYFSEAQSLLPRPSRR